MNAAVILAGNTQLKRHSWQNPTWRWLKALDPVGDGNYLSMRSGAAVPAGKHEDRED